MAEVGATSWQSGEPRKRSGGSLRRAAWQRSEAFLGCASAPQTRRAMRAEEFGEWSGRDSNSRPRPCQGRDLPTDLPPLALRARGGSGWAGEDPSTPTLVEARWTRATMALGSPGQAADI